MNINYGQILKNTTARQEALELLEVNLRELDVIRTHLTAAHMRLKGVWDAYRALDPEGMNLIGGLRDLLSFAGSNLVRVNDAQVFVDNLIKRIDANKDS